MTNAMDGQLHSHCENCFSKRCLVKAKPPDSCPMMSCDQDCGAIFHQCKLSEHLSCSCPEQRVACINRESGCPMQLSRRELGRHLETCPASVVYCTMEWNRWPVYSKERKARVPFTQTNSHASHGQLDVALALRDQRALNAARKAPRKTRQALRNNLNQRFPAVPICVKPARRESGENGAAAGLVGDNTGLQDGREVDAPGGRRGGILLSGRSLSEDEKDMEASSNRRLPPGLQSSMCSKLFDASKRAADSLSAALDVVTDNYHDNGDDVSPYVAVGDGDFCDSEMVGVASTEAPYGPEGEPKTDCTLADLRRKEITQRDYSILVCDIANSAQENSANPTAAHGSDANPDEHTVIASVSGNALPVTMPPPSSGDPEQRVSAIPDPPQPPPSLTLNELLGLDLNLESITRYQAKPRSMYTFLCAQAFRRDEYPWHFRTVHSDIHSGLNGWLEQRCPLACYGCTYSVRRLYPNNPGDNVVWSPIFETFGIQPYVAPENLARHPSGRSSEDPADELPQAEGHAHDPESKTEILTSKDYSASVCTDNGWSPREPSSSSSMTSSSSPLCPLPEDVAPEDVQDALTLADLPHEVLRHVARFLDGFSLNNLSLTSRQLREVCCGLLEDMGIVLLEWERQPEGEQPQWQVAYKRWMFSLAAEPVTRWRFQDGPSVSTHLRQCRYNDRLVREVPTLVMPLAPCLDVSGCQDNSRQNDADKAIKATLCKLYPAWKSGPSTFDLSPGGL